MNYYDEVLEDIKSLIEKNELSDAEYLIRKELEMPYIPAEVDAQLKKYSRDIKFLKSNNISEQEETLESLLRKLKGRPQSQLMAAYKLQDKNLRNCIDEIKDWLSKDPMPEASAFIIEALAEQEISEEFTFTRNGIEYTFYGDEVIPVIKSGGFNRALKLLENWFIKDPSLLEMAKTLLVNKAYMYLPLSYDDEEAGILAKDVAEEVCTVMGDTNLLRKIKSLDY